MTIRQVGATGIKLVGVYFAASGLIGVAGLLASFAVPRMEGLPSAREMLAANALSVAGILAVASVCLFRADSIASRIFEDELGVLDALSRHDLLEVGLVLLGVSTALVGVPTVLRFVGTALWYSEGSRQSMFAATMEQSRDALISAVLKVLIGGALALSAKRLSSVLDSAPVV